MKNIDVRELTIKETIGDGSYSIVKKCLYQGKEYAYKEFYNAKLFLTPKNTKKYEKLSELNEPFIVSPKHFIVYKNEKIGYISELVKGALMDDLKKRNSSETIENLKKMKVNLERLHQLGIIHSDIQHLNIIDNKLIDFDSASYKGYRPDAKYVSDFASEFLKTYGLSKELDIAMFNLLTYYLLSDVSYFFTRIAIANEEYSIFQSKEQKAICNNLLLQDKTPTSEYLIDTITR